jgi:hypothetical protein
VADVVGTLRPPVEIVGSYSTTIDIVATIKRSTA